MSSSCDTTSARFLLAAVNSNLGRGLALALLTCSAALPSSATVENEAEPAQRIISLAPHLTEMLFSLEVGERVVGTVRFSDYPPEAGEIEVLGDAFSVSVEAVVAKSPDLVVTWATGGNRDTVVRLSELGLRIYTHKADSLAGVADALLDLGRLVGREQRARELGDAYRQRLAALTAQYAQAGPSVFFQIGEARLFTVNGEHFMGEALTVCGARNIFHDLTVPVPVVSLEEVMVQDPSLVVMLVTGADLNPGDIEPWRRLGWSDRVRPLSAPELGRASLRVLDGVERLCKLIR